MYFETYYIIPLQAILIFNIIDFTPLTYGSYQLPDWAQAVGWLMAVASVAIIPIVSIYVVYQSYKDEELDGLSFGKVSCIITFAKDILLS